MFDIYTWSMRIEIAKACLPVVTVLSLDFNEKKLFCYTNVSPCLYIQGSKDDRKTKYTAISC